MEEGDWLTLSKRNIVLAPGDSEELEIYIKNSSRWIKAFNIHVAGIEPQWYEISTPQVVLFPNEEAISTLTVTVPSVAVGKSFPLDIMVASTGDGGIVNDLTMTPDGAYVVVGMDDGSLRVIDYESGAEERVIRSGRQSVRGVAMAPDGTRLFTGMDDGSLRVIDYESGAEERVIKSEGYSITGLSMTPDGTRLIIGVDDESVRVFDLRSRQEERVIKSEGRSVRGVTITPDGTRLIVGSGDGSLRALNFRSGVPERLIRAGGYPVRGVAMTPDGTHLVIGSDDGDVRVLDLRSGEDERTLETSEVTTINGHIEIQPPEDQTIEYEAVLENGVSGNLKLSPDREAVAAIALRNDSSWPEAFSVAVDGLPDYWTGRLFLGDDSEQKLSTQDPLQPFSLIPVPSGGAVDLKLKISTTEKLQAPQTLIVSFTPHLNIGPTKPVLVELEPD